MRILITGAGGLIGRVIAKHFTKKGHEVFGVDINPDTKISPRFIIDNDANFPQFLGKKYFVADITDIAGLKKIIEEIKSIDIVIHMAAALENQSPEEIHRVNILGTQNIFTLCVEEKITRIIVASSIMTIWDKILTEEPYCQIYQGTYAGCPEDIPKIKPDTVCVLKNPENERVAAYVASKIAIEKFITDFTKTHDITVVCARLGSISTSNRPYNKGASSIWCGHNDLCSFMEKAAIFLNEISLSGVHTYFVCSKNRYLFVDMQNAQKEIGYVPNDNADNLVPHSRYLTGAVSVVTNNNAKRVMLDGKEEKRCQL